jgi:hypothetical protein
MRLLLVTMFFITGCSFLQQRDPNLGIQIPTTQPQENSNNSAINSQLPGMSKEWSKVLLSELKAQLPQLDKATDLPRFCPNYARLSPEKRLVVWGYIATAIIKRESGFNTCSTMKESTGQDSIGFFQLSYGDRFCPRSKSEGNLCDGSVNIKCGAKLFGYFVDVDKVVASGGYTKYGAPAPKGLAHYWSVIRVPDSKSKHHLQEIIDTAKKAPGCLL